MPEKSEVGRREFLEKVAAGAAWAATAGSVCAEEMAPAQKAKHPNLVFVFGDQWRAQATGYAGDPNVLTPHLDALGKESVVFTNAISGCPVCTPYRASLMTGQYWLTHGAFMNDVCLRDEAVSIAEAFNAAGYDTAYIGKWHLDGHGRSAFIPEERRQGFRFWRVLECTHNYNHSCYYGDENVKREWEGYDAIAQTREARRYIRDHPGGRPFALFLSWGPPHNPYETAPEKFQQLYDPERLVLRPNVPEDHAEQARRELAGYYAHISAMDACIGELLETLCSSGLENDTVFIFTSDHGDMLHSQGMQRKQKPFDESIRVPFMVRYPAGLGSKGRTADTLLNSPDIAPSVLGLCGVPVPETMEGRDLSAPLLQGQVPETHAALLICAAPFGEWARRNGGKEYRGIRTKRHTYCRDLNGPWLLYDNETDPYQLKNLCGRAAHATIQANLDALLEQKLKDTNDTFRPADEYIEQWGYPLDDTGTVPFAS